MFRSVLTTSGLLSLIVIFVVCSFETSQAQTTPENYEISSTSDSQTIPTGEPEAEETTMDLQESETTSLADITTLICSVFQNFHRRFPHCGKLSSTDKQSLSRSRCRRVKRKMVQVLNLFHLTCVLQEESVTTTTTTSSSTSPSTIMSSTESSNTESTATTTEPTTITTEPTTMTTEPTTTTTEPTTTATEPTTITTEPTTTTTTEPTTTEPTTTATEPTTTTTEPTTTTTEPTTITTEPTTTTTAEATTTEGSTCAGENFRCADVCGGNEFTVGACPGGQQCCFTSPSR